MRRMWSPAVRARFLAVLAEQGVPTRAAAAVGMAVSGLYDLRKRDPDFAADWAAALEAARLAKAARMQAALPAPGLLVDHKVRANGWTEARQKTFLRALGETGCVTDACKRAAMSTHSAYQLRKRQPAFARAWQRAQAKGMTNVEQAAFARAVEGWDEPVLWRGEVVAWKRRYSDSLLRVLLGRGDLSGRGGARRGAVAAEAAGAERGAAAPGAGASRPKSLRALQDAAYAAAKAAGGHFIAKPATEAETDAALLKKLAGLRARLVREAAERDEAMVEGAARAWAGLPVKPWRKGTGPGEVPLLPDTRPEARDVVVEGEAGVAVDAEVEVEVEVEEMPGRAEPRVR